MNKNLRRTCITLAVAFGFASSASAALITYSDRTAFNAAVGTTTAEDFESIVGDTSFILPSTVIIGAMTFSGTAGFNGIRTQKIDAPPAQFDNYTTGSTDVLADLVWSATAAPNYMRIDFSSGVTAWGADFVGISDDGRVSGIDIFDASNVLLGSITAATAAGEFNQRFIGFELTSGAADHLIFLNTGAPNAPSNVDVFVMDNVALKTVPEPGTLALFGLGLAGLGALRRRRAA